MATTTTTAAASVSAFYANQRRPSSLFLKTSSFVNGKAFAVKINDTRIKSSKNGKVRFTVKALANGSPELEEDPVGIISGEWPESTALPNFDDLRAYLESHIISKKVRPNTPLREVMSKQLRTAMPDQTLEEVKKHFDTVSGLPVIDRDMHCVGVISKKDLANAPSGMNSKVGDVMSSPPITLSPEGTVMDATVLMLKMKIHRIPIVNEENKPVGIVTRSDIFQALETMAV